MPVQSSVCLAAIMLGKKAGLVKNLSRFDPAKGKKCWLSLWTMDKLDLQLTIPGFPVSVLLVGMIYSSAKSLQYLSVPVYTIFKNLTIIVIAYGEVLFFGARVSGIILLSFGLMVFSSVVAAWADIQAAFGGAYTADTSEAVSALSAGYAWMGINVFCNAAFLLTMRQVIKSLDFKDMDSMCWLQPQETLLTQSLTFEISHVL